MSNENKMIKDDLTRRIATATGLTHIKTKEIVQQLFDDMIEVLANNEKIEFRDFGVFNLKVAKQKTGRNPNKPKKDIIIPEHVIVKFQAGLKLKKRVLKIKSKDVK
jgi:integration host factor subunit alpha